MTTTATSRVKVAVLGGGVAGMSAAHELAERGFMVEVCERQPRYVGGKARSVDVPFDKLIKLPGGALGNLASAAETPALAPVLAPRAGPTCPASTASASSLASTGTSKKLFAHNLWQILTFSYERRQQAYERQSWWDFMQTDA